MQDWIGISTLLIGERGDHESPDALQFLFALWGQRMQQ
jgi:hypothetical protein